MDAETLFLGSTRDGVVGSLGFGSGYKGLTPTAAGSPMGSTKQSESEIPKRRDK